MRRVGRFWGRVLIGSLLLTTLGLVGCNTNRLGGPDGEGAIFDPTLLGDWEIAQSEWPESQSGGFRLARASETSNDYIWSRLDDPKETRPEVRLHRFEGFDFLEIPVNDPDRLAPDERRKNAWVILRVLSSTVTDFS